MSRGKVERWSVIYRPHLREHREKLFVFGDNMVRKGLGNQAREMRGEPNAVGIPTKWRPGRLGGDYFTDAALKNRMVTDDIRDAFDRLEIHLTKGGDVVMPVAGIGTGMAQLATRAPAVLAYINELLALLERGT
jgi:hypothetical protein